MNPKRTPPPFATALLAGWASLQGLPALAEPVSVSETVSAQDVSPGILAALREAQGRTEEQLLGRLTFEAQAIRLEQELSKALGERFGGAWLSEEGTHLLVGVTTEAGAALVRRAGAEPRRVARSQAFLERVKAELDAQTRNAPPSVHSWYVDLPGNRVAVEAEDAHSPQSRAHAFIARSSGAADGTIQVVPSKGAPRPVYDVRGGDPCFIGGARCTVGFSVNGGFITSGHCGSAGATVTGYNGVVMGTVQASVFPGKDYAWVATNSSWTPQPWVNTYGGGNVIVTGAQAAVVGASVCRAGPTTGWRCGTVLARNATVNYAQGSVTGLVRTNVCSEPGDSGGPWLSGSQAQGMTSGGSGNCTSGGQTYFQPVQPVLSAYGLTLKTGSALTVSDLDGWIQISP
ncbi:S1 family peptidase [Stigmatella aurantiaca]|uniref:Peptidase, S1E (Streptogrisin A) subfamily n=1 Tax=Stigmatella aurantiaca (strain DW4/3-1) TaxID=378806 RepID=Q095L8_STIAD|nr:S1 family peptidase [Stigmatella aurantiaca]ADO68326.1 Peptidase, S1E (Streptogrisin A) subfamily [Stigmatella aurantiaca DW4/3-1]EAU67417.1 serine protease C [Stigmatella aurantiaca DW4/3-1]